MIAFELSMPGVGSWNGRWSGAGYVYAKVVSLGRGRKDFEREAEIVAGSPYRYDFGDGWSASVTVRCVDAAGARSLRRRSLGFCGYDWMLEEIIVIGRIRMLGERSSA
jgi:hypothetical protein